MNKTLSRLGISVLAAVFAPTLLAANLQSVDVAALPGHVVMEPEPALAA